MCFIGESNILWRCARNWLGQLGGLVLDLSYHEQAWRRQSRRVFQVRFHTMQICAAHLLAEKSFPPAAEKVAQTDPGSPGGIGSASCFRPRSEKRKSCDATASEAWHAREIWTHVEGTAGLRTSCHPRRSLILSVDDCEVNQESPSVSHGAVASQDLELNGYGSKLNHQGPAGFGPCFHLPGFHFGYIFLTHSQILCTTFIALCQGRLRIALCQGRCNW